MTRKFIPLTLSAMLFVLSLFCVALLALCVPAQAQQAKKVFRIGHLSAVSLSAESSRLDGFRQGLRITGLTGITPELSGKRVELLKEAFPKMSRVTMFADRAVAASVVDRNLQETQLVARTLGIKLDSLEIQGRNPDLDSDMLSGLTVTTSMHSIWLSLLGVKFGR